MFNFKVRIYRFPRDELLSMLAQLRERKAKRTLLEKEEAVNHDGCDHAHNDKRIRSRIKTVKIENTKEFLARM